MAARELLEEVELTREKVLERIEKDRAARRNNLRKTTIITCLTICRRSWSLIWKKSGWANGNYREFIKKGKRKGKQERGNTMDMFSHSESWKEESGSWENTVTGTSEILNRFWQKKTKAAW